MLGLKNSKPSPRLENQVESKFSIGFRVVWFNLFLATLQVSCEKFELVKQKTESSLNM